MGKNDIHISDFVKLDEFQELQDNWTKATGIAFITVDYNGKPFTKQSGFTDFCRVLREHEEYRELCYFCDACGGRRAKRNGRPYVYICHAGLVDFAIPISINGQYVGAILAGQINAQDKKELKPITAKKVDWQKDPELVELYQQIPKLSLDKIQAVSNTIYESYNYVAEKEYINKVDKELKEKKLKLMKEEKLRIEMEKSIKDIELKALHYQINPHFLFNVLNTIGRLAFFENAKMTEDVVYAFSDMMRYVLKKSSNQLGPLKDELAHVSNYLKIQKIRLGSRLQYTIQASDQFMDIKVPFMCLQPIVENSIKYAVENRSAGGTIGVDVYQEERDLHVDITDDGDGISKERIDEILDGEAYNNGHEHAVGLHNVDSRLKLYFGKEYGLQIESAGKSGLGTKVSLKVPMDSKGFQGK
ncbi:MAG: PocR ligand-binding domain-containing protein [Lachnospiraceae bacterium]|nr:PocR ligand-binding domain-containing protein [Lachnospiraceae bacterium]